MYDNEPYLGGFAMYPYNNMYNANKVATNQQNSIVWVQGVEGAKAYQMTPNTNILLMDSENNGRFYIKSCDSIGMCSLRYFDYVETSATKEVDTSAFVTRDELSNIINELKEGMKREQPVPTVESNTKYSGKR